MPATPSKLVTIITDSASGAAIERRLQEMNVTSYSVTHVRGRGRHGYAGVLQGANLEFLVVTDASTAAKLLEWAEREFIPNYAGIAFASDVLAVMRDKSAPRSRA